MTIRVRFKVDQITKSGDVYTLGMSPVHNGSDTAPENRDQVPLSGGALVMSTVQLTASKFSVGADYFIVIMPVIPETVSDVAMHAASAVAGRSTIPVAPPEPIDGSVLAGETVAQADKRIAQQRADRALALGAMLTTPTGTPAGWAQPGYPGYAPGQPGYQANQPGQPGYPQGQNPGQPGYANANQPGYPGSTQDPAQPAYPGSPTPGQPGYVPGALPGQPGYPASYAQTPGLANQPGQPGYPQGAQPGQPGYPGYAQGSSVAYAPGYAPGTIPARPPTPAGYAWSDLWPGETQVDASQRMSEYSVYPESVPTSVAFPGETPAQVQKRLGAAAVHPGETQAQAQSRLGAANVNPVQPDHPVSPNQLPGETLAQAQARVEAARVEAARVEAARLEAERTHKPKPR